MMTKAIIFKEWLKLRLPGLIMALVFIIIVGKIAVTTAYEIRFLAPKTYWYNITIRGIRFFSDLYYLPALTGIVFAIAQFFPEINAKRLTLALHLPFRQSNMLLTMLGFGSLTLIILFAVVQGLLMIISSYFFPMEITASALMTMAPWFLCGLVCYFGTALIFIEPLWTKRLLYFVIFYGFADILLMDAMYNAYTHSLAYFSLITAFLILTPQYALARFRKGLM